MMKRTILDAKLVVANVRGRYVCHSFVRTCFNNYVRKPIAMMMVMMMMLSKWTSILLSKIGLRASLKFPGESFRYFQSEPIRIIPKSVSEPLRINPKKVSNLLSNSELVKSEPLIHISGNFYKLLVVFHYFT